MYSVRLQGSSPLLDLLSQVYVRGVIVQTALRSTTVSHGPTGHTVPNGGRRHEHVQRASVQRYSAMRRPFHRLDRSIGCRRLQSAWKPPTHSPTAVRDQQQKKQQSQQKQALSSSSSLSWLQQVRDLAVQVPFVYTGSSNARNTNECDINGGGDATDVQKVYFHNEVEARVIGQSVDFLTGDGVTAERITVLSPF